MLKFKKGKYIKLVFLPFLLFFAVSCASQGKNKYFLNSKAGDIVKIADMCKADGFFNDCPIGMIIEIQEIKKNRVIEGEWFMIEGIVQEKFNGKVYSSEKAWIKGEWAFFYCIKVQEIE